MTKDTRLIIGAIMMSSVIVIGVNKAEIRESREDIRELRGLLISHTSGYSHSTNIVDESEEAK